MGLQKIETWEGEAQEENDVKVAFLAIGDGRREAIKAVSAAIDEDEDDDECEGAERHDE